MRREQIEMADNGWCPGSRHYSGVGDKTIGLDQVVCPFCERPIVANRVTGKLARHKANPR